MHNPALLVLADLALVLALGSLLKPLLRRLRQPPVIAEIVAGLALGPSLLGLLPGNPTEVLFPAPVRESLSAIAQVGILLFMFLIGWEMNMGQLRRQRGEVLAVSLSAIAVPFLAGMALATYLYAHHDTVGGHRVDSLGFKLFVGAAMAITAFPVLARIVRDCGLRKSRVGTVALAGAAVGDLIAWCLLIVVSVVAVSAGPERLVRVALLGAVLAAVLVLLVRPLLRRLLRPRAGRLPELVLPVLAAGALATAYCAAVIGLDGIFGAFAFGLVMPRDLEPAVSERISSPFEQITALLMPVFFVTTGLSVDITRLGGSGLLELAAILVVACLSKMLAAYGTGRLIGLGHRDAGLLGFLMNTRGLTELVILNAGMSLGVLDVPMFTMMVIMALVTTGMAGFVLPRAEPEQPTIPAPAPRPHAGEGSPTDASAGAAPQHSGAPTR
ncbi:cation:proton antiporter [Streptomyces viridochromogenes]|uniref:Putative membrane antiporter n=1 Tax=Streptomyces viridochromogenes Tue57 TaxID=1160705 RepID=L8PJ94_STRVR|nr:cation:proton antiporter [Streptomyces viridochromogenes]ELS56304.1 putative membrane antiporter [Streptomyces viridochromogenes Tue57]